MIFYFLLYQIMAVFIEIDELLLFIKFLNIFVFCAWCFCMMLLQLEPKKYNPHDVFIVNKLDTSLFYYF